MKIVPVEPQTCFAVGEVQFEPDENGCFDVPADIAKAVVASNRTFWSLYTGQPVPWSAHGRAIAHFDRDNADAAARGDAQLRLDSPEGAARLKDLLSYYEADEPAEQPEPVIQKAKPRKAAAKKAATV